VAGKFVCQWALALGNWIAPSLSAALVGTSPVIPWRTVFLSAFIGTYSHVFLDSIMHSDVQPFAPLSATNPFFHLIDVGLMHILCLLAGLVGFAGLITVSRPGDQN
jgi:membrane-bound metal-dependent hydrolase YbcI (DUF457 family)